MGSKTAEVPVVVVEQSKCPKCGSTARTDYTNTKTMDFAGIRNGVPYTKITWRHTKCLNCGQHRRDMTYQ